MFKFGLKSLVIKKKKDKNVFVIIGRMDSINQPIRYLLQEQTSYNQYGYRFDKGHWEYESELNLIKSKK